MILSRVNVLALLTTTLLASCATTPGPRTPVASQHLNGAAATHWLSSQKRGAKFVTHGGKMYNTDHDAIIELFPDHSVKLEICGYGLDHYTGTYAVESSGTIRLAVPKSRVHSQVMYLERNASGVYLFPVSEDPGFQANGRPRVSEKAAVAPYWLYRQVRR